MTTISFDRTPIRRAVAPVAARSVAARSAAPAQPKLRLTRRGRRVLVILFLVPVLFVAALLGSGALSAGASGAAGEREQITVLGGQTLWSISEQLAPEADPRDVIAEIVALNELASAEVMPGQQLLIPAHYTD